MSTKITKRNDYRTSMFFESLPLENGFLSVTNKIFVVTISYISQMKAMPLLLTWYKMEKIQLLKYCQTNVYIPKMLKFLFFKSPARENYQTNTV